MTPEKEDGPGYSDSPNTGRPDNAGARGAAGGRMERERLSADYDDDAPARRRPAPAVRGTQSGGMSSMLGQDPATRKLVMGALGIGAILVAAVGGWSLMGGHHGGIPIIGPPPGPVKDRPTDPGGMQIMGGEGSEGDITGKGDAHLAPAPEQPDATALARQYGVPPGSVAPQDDKPAEPVTASKTSEEQATSASPGSPDAKAGSPTVPDSSTATAKQDEKAATAPEVPPSAPEAPAAVEKDVPKAPEPKPAPPVVHHAAPAAPKPVIQKPLALPQPSPDVVKPSASAAETTPAMSVPGNREVQLAALDSEASAKVEWEKLRAQAPAVFAGHSPTFQKTMRGDHTFVRLRIGGFPDFKAARAFCVKLHAQSVACTPAQF